MSVDDKHNDVAIFSRQHGGSLHTRIQRIFCLVYTRSVFKNNLIIVRRFNAVNTIARSLRFRRSYRHFLADKHVYQR